jgi:hypothetical protein
MTKSRTSQDRSFGAQISSFIASLLDGRAPSVDDDLPSHDADCGDVREIARPVERILAPGPSGNELRQTLTPLLKDDGVLGANLQVLGLASLRKKVGAQWPSVRTVIHTAVEHILGKALTPHDCFVRVGDDLYVIAFDDTDSVSTARRTAEIGAAIVKQLLGDEGGIGVSVQMLGGRLTLNHDGNVVFTEEQAEVPGRAAEGEPDRVEWASRQTPAAKDDNTEEIDRLIREASDIHESKLRAASETAEARVADAPKADPAVHRDKAVFPYTIGFAPIWDARKKAITTYAVLPHRRTNAGWRFGHDVLGSLPGVDEILELDVACLRAAIRETASSYKNNRAVLVLSQVHYWSISSKSGLTLLLKECARIPEFLRKYVAIQVVGMPAEISMSAAATALSMLHRHVRLIAARPHPAAAAATIKQLGFDILCVVQDEPEFTLVERAKMQRRVAEATAQGLPVVVEAVPVQGVAAELAELGIAHMSGLFAGEPLEEPMGLLWRDLDDFPLKVLRHSGPRLASR